MMFRTVNAKPFDQLAVVSILSCMKIQSNGIWHLTTLLLHKIHVHFLNYHTDKIFNGCLVFLYGAIFNFCIVVFKFWVTNKTKICFHSLLITAVRKQLIHLLSEQKECYDKPRQRVQLTSNTWQKMTDNKGNVDGGFGREHYSFLLAHVLLS